MIEFATVARPYAKALFELAKENKQVKQWFEGLSLLAQIISQPEMESFIGRVDLDVTQKVQDLLELLGNIEATQNENFKNFLTVLTEEKRLEVLPEIFTQYQKMILEKEHTKQAIIYTAYDIASEGQRAKIINDLEQHFQVSLQADFQTDANLIGGIKVVLGDQVLDLSVQGKLKQLQATMTN